MLSFFMMNEASRSYDENVTLKHLGLSVFGLVADGTHLRLIGHFRLYCFTSLLTVAVPTPAMAPTSCMYFWA